MKQKLQALIFIEFNNRHLSKTLRKTQHSPHFENYLDETNVISFSLNFTK